MSFGRRDDPGHQTLPYITPFRAPTELPVSGPPEPALLLAVVAVTLGWKGALLRAEGGSRFVPAAPARLVDATGAGDAWVAGLIAGLQDGMAPWTAGARAAGLAAAGVNRLNVSLDTLRPDRFAAITRRDRLADVLSGMAAARDAGLSPVKINSVLLRGVNDDEAVDLLRFAVARRF